MTPTSLPDSEEPYFYTTSNNSLIVVERGSVSMFDPEGGEITLSLSVFLEVVAKLREARIIPP